MPATSGWNQVKNRKNPYLNPNAPYGATFTFTAEGTPAANARNVTIQLTDRKGAAVSGRKFVDVYLADAATGAAVTAVVPTSALAIGTNGVIWNSITTNKHVRVQTNATGAVDINVVQTAVQNYYVVVVLPDGSLVISSVLAFA